MTSLDREPSCCTAGAPRGLVVAGLGGGSGKSVIAVGLTAALARRGLRVAPFKKGPDYIDAGWLQLAAANPCYNLDPYLMTPSALIDSFRRHSRSAQAVVIEGNRGLYDGVDAQGSYSTAELAIQLGLPVLLVVDCTKTTRTVAAMVLGCQRLDPRVAIRGVVLNRIGSPRHERIIREAVERYTGVPVLGAVPRLRDVFPQRHLGITPCPEHTEADGAVAALAAMAESHLDLDGVLGAMAEVELPAAPGAEPGCPAAAASAVRIGILKDAAFQFYYAENLKALADEGAELVEIDALRAPELPELAALYIGGGFPETSARQLAANGPFRASLKERAMAGLPVYAECGGLIYLGESMILEGEEFPLVGVFPVKFGLEKKPQAHGYTILQAVADNPYYPRGVEIRGHEFRYSRVLEWRGETAGLALQVKRGVGFADGRDGLVHRNVLALYTHVHAVGTPLWAKALVAKAREYQKKISDE
ncbi:MAG: cobyrinate a,c-diamide synthase [Desulfobacteraceae bacterium]|nr:cobyrinate a,c-diamide synthase [Desulfobacteraceae bacterium]